MGNAESSPAKDGAAQSDKNTVRTVDGTPIKRGFPGSAVLESTLKCGNVADTDDRTSTLYEQADNFLCGSPTSQDGNGERFVDDYDDDDDDDGIVASPPNPTSALFAKALVNEVSPGQNPKTMTPAQMAERERRLLKAQLRAKQLNQQAQQKKKASRTSCASEDNVLDPEDMEDNTEKPIGMLEKASILGSLAHAVGADSLISNKTVRQATAATTTPRSPNTSIDADDEGPHGQFTVTIGLLLSRRSKEGHSKTVTRQTAFDFNELQDREYKYVSSTDERGWRAGGGETGKPLDAAAGPQDENGPQQRPKKAAADTSHIPIITIDAQSQHQVDLIISALARGEIFIPQMAILPEALSVHGISPPDVVVRFGTERNDDLPPEDWPNWCLEFLHNQLYEYFTNLNIPVRWNSRPFRVTLAKQVRWKTVKHMNQYFANAEQVIDSWREAGPQYLNPQLAYIEGGATPEEVARPHGIYLLRNGVPTNYFAPNFDGPYSTKMTRSLLQNVLAKSWDKKRREWASEPIPRLVAPSVLLKTMLGCGENNPGGYMATEVTLSNKMDTSNIPDHLISHLSLSSSPTKHGGMMGVDTSSSSAPPKPSDPTPRNSNTTKSDEGNEGEEGDVVSDVMKKVQKPPASEAPERGNSVATTILHTNMADKEEKKEEPMTGDEAKWLVSTLQCKYDSITTCPFQLFLTFNSYLFHFSVKPRQLQNETGNCRSQGSSRERTRTTDGLGSHGTKSGLQAFNSAH